MIGGTSANEIPGKAKYERKLWASKMKMNFNSRKKQMLDESICEKAL